jgi:hypothetical protein
MALRYEVRDTEWVHRLDPQFLECRSLRHAWDLNKFEVVARDDISIRVDPSAQVLSRRLTCRRCSTVKLDYYVRENKQNLNGFYRHSSRYLYPKGYTFNKKEHELDSPKPNDYIIESFRRASVI